MPRGVEQLMVAECLSGRVRILNRVISGIYDAKLRPFGIRASQSNILVVIAARGPIGATTICQSLCLDKSTLSRDLDRLVDHGWVSVAAGAGRVRPLEITESGRRLIDSLKSAWEEAQAEARKLLGDVFSAELFRVVDQSLCHQKSDELVDVETTKHKTKRARVPVEKKFR
jgi:DNA-binding MarR family transcriptional regulator